MEIYVNKFLSFLTAENQKQNLISRKTGEEELISHIEDSLKVLNFFPLVDQKVIDIGSGAGFPALVLAIYCPQAQFTLVEADLKKSEFLTAACAELKLANVQVIRERVEILGRDPLYRGQYDICTSRAVAAMNIMLEYGVPLLKKKGRLLLWKGRNYQQEIRQAQKALEVLNARVEETYLYNVLEEKDRAIIEVVKEMDCPEKYPRRVGIPAKRPLE